MSSPLRRAWNILPRSRMDYELRHELDASRADRGRARGFYYHYSERARTLDRLALYATDDVALTGPAIPSESAWHA